MNLIASNKYCVVLGLGLTGLSALRYLLKQGVKVVVCDTRDNPPNLTAVKYSYPELSIITGKLDEELLLNAAEIIISPGISRKEPAIQKAINSGVSVIGDVELFSRVVNAPVIAITGSNGKSTVTTLVGEMARAGGIKTAVVGNIGAPVLDALDTSIELYVLELSSFQLESTYSLKPIAATILNVSADHMDRYQSVMEYALTKQRIAFGAKTVVVNKQDPLTEPPIATGVRRVFFSVTPPDLKDFGFSDGEIVKGLTPLINQADIKITGKHNIANATAALALAEAAGIPLEPCLVALKTFAGLKHRCELVACIAGVRFINDSKATNVGAAIAALNGLSAPIGNIHIILGGDGKGADFSALIPTLKRTAKRAILLGKDAPVLLRIIQLQAPNLDVVLVDSLEEAVLEASKKAINGDIVLLSPACASLDMFKNFEHRGEVFSQAVRGLAR